MCKEQKPEPGTYYVSFDPEIAIVLPEMSVKSRSEPGSGPGTPRTKEAADAHRGWASEKG